MLFVPLWDYNSVLKIVFETSGQDDISSAICEFCSEK